MESNQEKVKPSGKHRSNKEEERLKDTKFGKYIKFLKGKPQKREQIKSSKKVREYYAE